MNTFFFPLLMGASDAGAAGSSASLISTFIPFGLVILIFYFLIIRPQNKKQKETERMLSALKKGDKIVTIGGIHGIIHSVKDASLVVKVDENTRIEFSRSAVASVVNEAKAASKAKVAKKDDATLTEPEAKPESEPAAAEEKKK